MKRTLSCLAMLAVAGAALPLTRRNDVADALMIANGTTFANAGATAYITNGSISGTGVLIAPGYVLTAAHVLTTAANTFSVSFNADVGTGSPTFYAGSQKWMHPNWTGDLTQGVDLAILKLATNPAITPVPLYAPTSEIGLTGQVLGYGRYGTGATGDVSAPDGKRRGGNNVLDVDGSAVGWSTNLVLSDFDSGLGGDNAFGTATQTTFESNVAPGDSGGPVFANFSGTWRLVGITSFYASFDGLTNADYGDISGWSRISTRINQDFINSVVPEPGTIAAIGLGLAALARRRRKV